ncbi:hypothetical protein TthWC1_1682 [Thermoanaerobacter thermohydrosulfuricus WC1]|uniref:Uncharacterized protein n=3 Tax=Thermoanaerobacter TaxID=1754 RepID=D3T372_THEIA|nr:hypothetical protein [Thermoanaerobacter italicus]ADD02674.1 conserved hypothetical protein [Thermoanaerobacter italicus Ab9]EMT38777.1 hypothetical protein TthWC1_1682 [Thermoanaerobacter thermohydrosulfuricus WC1]
MKRFIKFLNRHFMLKDFIFSVIVTLLFLYITKEFKYENAIINLFDGIRQQLYGTMTGFFGTLLGFIITGLSILITMSDNKKINVLKRSKYYIQVYKSFIYTSLYLALATVISLIGLVIDKDISPHLFYLYILFWSSIISFISIIRCIWILDRMIQLKIEK